MEYPYEGESYDGAVVQQIQDLISFVHSKNIPEGETVMLVGDFNSGPHIPHRAQEYFVEGFDVVVNDGWVDTFGTDGTYDFDNELAAEQLGVFLNNDIDHIFIRTSGELLRVVDSELIFQEEYQVSPNRTIPLSDHYGVRTRFCSLP